MNIQYPFDALHKHRLGYLFCIICTCLVFASLIVSRWGYTFNSSTPEYKTIENTWTEKQKCDGLFHSGRFVNGSWQPVGCSLHNYNHSDMLECLRVRMTDYKLNNTMRFIGDSRVRYYFQEVYRLVTGKKYSKPIHRNGGHQNASLKLTLNFYWSPYITQQRRKVFNSWANHYNKFDKKPPEARSQDMDFIMAGGGILWTGVHKTNDVEHLLPQYIGNFTKLLPPLKNISKAANVYWMLQEDIYSKNPNSTEAMHTYNKVTRDIISTSSIDLWESNTLIPRGFKKPSKDSIHFIPPILEIGLQILVNWYCNPYMQLPKEVCCSQTAFSE